MEQTACLSVKGSSVASFPTWNVKHFKDSASEMYMSLVLDVVVECCKRSE